MSINFIKYKKLHKCLALLVTIKKSSERVHRKELRLLRRMRQARMKEIAFGLGFA